MLPFNHNQKEPVCNICGQKLDVFDRQENYTIKTTCGYGTEYDGAKIELHLCCECMEKLIKSCKVSPVKEHRLPKVGGKSVGHLQSN